MTIYPEVIELLIKQCQQFRDGELDIDDMKAAIWHTATVVSSHEDKYLRQTLQGFEGEMDYIQVMAENENEVQKSKDLAQELEDYLRHVLIDPNHATEE